MRQAKARREGLGQQLATREPKTIALEQEPCGVDVPPFSPTQTITTTYQSKCSTQKEKNNNESISKR